MEVMQIAMVVIGLAIIAVSYIISEKVTQGDATYTPEIDEEMFNEKIEQVKNSINQQIDSMAYESVENAKDELAKLSNEKIMAFHDYSKQVMEKIEQNHNEVIFLYDMLNQKDEELKDSIRLANNAKKDIDDSILKMENDLPKERYDQESNEYKEDSSSIEDKNDQVENIIDMDDYNDFVEQNSNEEILKMYEAGSSIIEISKKLGIGQGEVKLVINLYKGANRK